MKIVNELEFTELIKEGYVLADFFADWCGPCKMLGPVLEDVSEKFPNVKFVKVDVEQDGALAAKFGVMSIPNVFLLKDGSVIGEFKGYVSANEVVNFLNRHIA